MIESRVPDERVKMLPNIVDAWKDKISYPVDCNNCANNKWYLFVNVLEKSRVIYGDCEICGQQQQISTLVATIA